MEVTESTAVREYEETTYMNKVARTSKDKDLEYRRKEVTTLSKSMQETASDKEGAQSELDAVLEYLAKLNKMCIAKAEPYAERAARRKAEIAGLKQALQILDGESVLLQEKSKRALRGA